MEFDFAEPQSIRSLPLPNAADKGVPRAEREFGCPCRVGGGWCKEKRRRRRGMQLLRSDTYVGSGGAKIRQLMKVEEEEEGGR